MHVQWMLSAFFAGQMLITAADVRRFDADDWVNLAVATQNARTLTVDAQGQLLVPGRHWRRLRRLDRAGDFQGNVYIESRFASAISADRQGHVWVVGSEPVSRYDLSDPTKDAVAVAGGFGTGMDEYQLVRAIAATADGGVLVLDSRAGRVLHYGVDGSFRETLTVSKEHQLSRGDWALTGIATDDNDAVYVVDQTRRRIVIFREGGTAAIGAGFLRRPTGIAVAPQGILYVGDEEAVGIHIFGPDGHHLAFLDTNGEGPGAIAYPWGMAVDDRGDLWVADAKGPWAKRFESARLLQALDIQQRVPESGSDQTFRVILPDAVVSGQPLLLTFALLRSQASGEESVDLRKLPWKMARVRLNERQLPVQVVDVGADGLGTADDCLAIRCTASAPAGSTITVHFTSAQPQTNVTSTVHEVGDQRMTLANDRIAVDLDGRNGDIHAIAATDAPAQQLSGDFGEVFVPAADDLEPTYRVRPICSGHLLAGLELLHLTPGKLRLVRRLWLWTGEPFLRDELQLSGTPELHVIHQLPTAEVPDSDELLTPDRALMMSFGDPGACLLTAVDETSLDSDGHRLERMRSAKLPGRAEPSAVHTRQQNGGALQRIVLRGRLKRLSLALGIARGPEDARRIYAAVNAPMRLEAMSYRSRSEYSVLAHPRPLAGMRSRPGLLNDFYHLGATFPDLSDLLSPDVDRKGFLRPEGEHFVFEDGTRLSAFFGGSVEWTGFRYLCVRGHRAHQPVGEVGVDQVVDVLARCGYDFVRWHHHDDPRISWIVDQKASRIDADGLDIFHRFLDRCNARGMRVNFGALLINRPFHQILPNLTRCQGSWDPTSPENIVPLFNDAAIQLQKDFASNLLTSYNPYRARRVVDDPTLAMVEIENERRYHKRGQARINEWKKLPEPYQTELQHLWNRYLLDKYGSQSHLAEQWRQHPLRENESLANLSVPLPEMKDTERGIRQRPDPRISDGEEFIYWLHKRYLQTMVEHLRSIGFKGIIFSNGDEASLAMRRAAAEVLDATATAGYARGLRLSYGLGPSHLPVAGKPSINREWGPRNDIRDSWFAILPHIISGHYLQQTYHFAFMTSAHAGIDHLLPDETISSWAFSGVAQNSHPSSFLGLTAAALASRFLGLDPPERRVELGIPYAGTFVDEGAAPAEDAHHRVADTAWYEWVPGKREKVEGIPPLRYVAYWPLRSRFFAEKLPATKALVTNYPFLPAGDYSSVDKLILSQPMSLWNRYGTEKIAPENAMRALGLRADPQSDQRSIGRIAGYVDTDDERNVLFEELIRIGYAPGTTLAEFGEVWRTADGTCQIDLKRNTFFIDRQNIQAAAGPLEQLSQHLSGISVATPGKGAVWWVPWSADGLGKSMLIAAMEGDCRTSNWGSIGFIYAQSSNLVLQHGDQLLLRIGAPEQVNITVKADKQDDIFTARYVFVTPLRPLSNRVPVQITLSGSRTAEVLACDAEGNAFLQIQTQYNDAAGTISFVTPNRQDIAFYTLIREPADVP